MNKNPTREDMKPKPKKVVKGWIVLCSEEGDWRAFKEMQKAINQAIFLDEEYRGMCTHKVIPVEIIIKHKSK